MIGPPFDRLLWFRGLLRCRSLRFRGRGPMRLRLLPGGPSAQRVTQVGQPPTHVGELVGHECFVAIRLRHGTRLGRAPDRPEWWKYSDSPIDRPARAHCQQFVVTVRSTATVSPEVMRMRTSELLGREMPLLTSPPDPTDPVLLVSPLAVTV